MADGASYRVSTRSRFYTTSRQLEHRSIICNRETDKL